jgi:hypothetical protein
MADSDVIRKLHVYRALYRLNRAFALLTHNLDQLLIAQVFKDDIPDEQNPSGWQMHLAQIQMEINRHLTQTLCNLEHGDIKRLHKIMDMDPRVRALMYGEDFDEAPPPRKRQGKKRR